MLIYGLIFSYLYSYWILPKQCGYYPYINPTLYPILYNGMLIIPYNKKKSNTFTSLVNPSYHMYYECFY